MTDHVQFLICAHNTSPRPAALLPEAYPQKDCCCICAYPRGHALPCVARGAGCTVLYSCMESSRSLYLDTVAQLYWGLTGLFRTVVVRISLFVLMLAVALLLGWGALQPCGHMLRIDYRVLGC